MSFLAMSGFVSTKSTRGGGSDKQRRILRVLILTLALTMLLMTGTAIASADVDPDSILYPVKRSLEDMHISVTTDPLKKAMIETSHADARLDELESMIDKGKYVYVQDLIISHEEHFSIAGDYIEAALTDGKDVSDVIARLVAMDERKNIILIRYADVMPVELQTAVADARQSSAYRNQDDTGGTGSTVPGHDPGSVDYGAAVVADPGNASGGNSTLPPSIAIVPDGTNNDTGNGNSGSDGHDNSGGGNDDNSGGGNDDNSGGGGGGDDDNSGGGNDNHENSQGQNHNADQQ